MKLLFVGDVMGRSGREALELYLPVLKRELSPDVTIVNGENAAHGRGLTEKMAKEFYALGADVITTGNHVWDQREIMAYIQRDPKLLRPMNYPKGAPGNGACIHQDSEGRKTLVVNLMGRLFMDVLDCPFQAMEDVLQTYKLGANCNAIFVDFHAETTSEKMAFSHHFSGRVSAVIGTHTHIPTADAHVMAGGTAFMADAGMTGDYDSVIGVRKDIAIHRFVKKTPGENFIPASEFKTLCGAFVTIDDKTGKALSIQPIRLGDTLSNTRP